MTKNNLNDIYKITNILQQSKLCPMVQEHFVKIRLKLLHSHKQYPTSLYKKEVNSSVR